MPKPSSYTTFAERWAPSGGAEHANYTLFLIELCQLLDLPVPDPTKSRGDGAYVFERSVRELNGEKGDSEVAPRIGQ